jgi:hypothetical protein
VAKTSGDVENDRFSAEEWREQTGPSKSDYDKKPIALGIDPGSKTGVAWRGPNGQIATMKTNFWELWEMLRSGHAPRGIQEETIDRSKCCVILEALYLSRQSMGAQPKIAYNSGQAARESELMGQWIKKSSYGLIEHDPASYDAKWDPKIAEAVTGGWVGPNNEHTRDALRLLFAYDYI